MSESSMKYSTLIRVASLVGVLVGVFYFSPTPQQRTKGVAQNPLPKDSELIEIARSMMPPPLPSWTEQDKARAQFGKKLFFDPGFSDDGTKSCAVCHQPQRYFTDGRALALDKLPRHTPSLVNSFAESWYFWDGRATSLEAQALGPLEANDEHGFDRGRIVQRVWDHYRSDYENLYGPWSSALEQWLKKEGDKSARPPEAPIELDAQVAQYALTTVSDTDLQDPFIKEASRLSQSPQAYFASHVFVPEPVPFEQRERYQNLDPKVREELELTLNKILNAIAQYERGLVALDSPFDRFVQRLPKTDSSSIQVESHFSQDFGPPEWQGYRTFVQASCTLCHTGPYLSDQQFHNIGLSQKSRTIDLGRAAGLLRARNNPRNCPPEQKGMSESCREWEYLRGDNPELVGAFKTPSLRNVAKTAPYMHDGRFSNLDEVLTHYSELSATPAIGHREEALRALQFTDEEKEDLHSFLESLSSPIRELSVE